MTLRSLSQLNFGEQKVLHRTQKFKLSIMERETRFYEEVEINEDEQFAHFHVPPHNGLAETDELFDFQMVGVSKHVSYFSHVVFNLLKNFNVCRILRFVA